MDRVRPGVTPRRHYVPYFIGSRAGHDGFSRSDGSENSSNGARRWFRVDGQRYGTSSADTLEKRLGTSSADALEERHGTSSADTVERYGTGSANTLERVSAV